MSSRNSIVDGVDERILDAAARMLTHSPRPPAIAELARQAGVSRPTVYRRFSDGDGVVKALWDREIGRLLASVPPADSRATLVAQMVDIADHISSDETLLLTFTSDRALMTHYIVDRLGTGQQVLLDVARRAIRQAQAGGTVRAGQPRQLAAMTMLIAQSAVQSRRMFAAELPGRAWRRELAAALDRYLAP